MLQLQLPLYLSFCAATRTHLRVQYIDSHRNQLKVEKRGWGLGIAAGFRGIASHGPEQGRSHFQTIPHPCDNFPCTAHLLQEYGTRPFFPTLGCGPCIVLSGLVCQLPCVTSCGPLSPMLRF